MKMKMKMKMMLCVVVALSLFVSCSLSGGITKDAFQSFVTRYGKVYDDNEEYQQRKAIFEENMDEIATVQAANPLGRFGVNEFSDLSKEEFSRIFLLQGMDIDDVANYKTDFSAPRHRFLVSDPDPTNYDWNSAGVVTPVYQQGRCGDCWAFAATETMESYWAIAGNPLTSLSVEQIIDCNARGSACNEGQPSTAYGYTLKVGGLESMDEYPYIAQGGTPGNCSFNDSGIVASISSWGQLSGEAGIYSQVSAGGGGPVTVCVDASTWRGYQGGVLTSCPDNPDHCVQVTGYANYGQGNPYWIVRNSWGTNWGQSGYIWIAIGGNLCGIGNHPSYVSA